LSTDTEKFTYKKLQLTNRNGKVKTTLTATRKNENMCTNIYEQLKTL